MIKKYKFIFSAVIAFSLLILSQCSVNQLTGLIQIKNYSNTPIKNVKIGDTLIALYVAPGMSVDYWFGYTISGKLASDGLQVNDSQSSITWNLKTNYWITVFAKSFSDGDSVALSYSKNGTQDNAETLVTE
jgi:hypothetical protein